MGEGRSDEQDILVTIREELIAEVPVPEGWEPVAEICRSVACRSDGVVDDIVTRIHRELPSYALGDPVTYTELRETVRINLLFLLQGAASRTGPPPAHIKACRRLGQHRAEQRSVPANDLIQAFVIGYRELWDQLIHEAGSEPPAARELLTRAAATIWEWVNEVTSAVGSGYHEWVGRNAALAGATRERFFSGLLGGGFNEEEFRGLAQSLGYEPDGAFVAIAVGALHGGQRAESLASRLAGADGRRHAVVRGEIVFVLEQRDGVSHLLEFVREAAGDPPIGIGLCRVGLSGAALSFGDAEQALELAIERGGVVAFEQDWHEATMVASRSRLADLLKIGIAQAEASPDLVETISTFTECGFVLTQTAQVMHVHPNTVSYRLSRWSELTGWDPRDRDGLLRSLAAFTLARARPAPR
jgi:hypothetical protein